MEARVLPPCLLPATSLGLEAVGALQREAGGVLRFPARPGRRHPQHPAAARTDVARLIPFLSSFQLIKASRHPAEDSLPVSLEGKAGP